MYVFLLIILLLQVYFDSNWAITSALCSCPRGQLICHHMACLLLFSRENISITDESCRWNVPKSKDNPVTRIRDIFPKKERRATERNLTEQEIEEFRKKLSIFDGAVGFSWLLSPECEASDKNLVIDIEELLFSELYNDSTNKVQFFEETMKISDEDIEHIAKETVGQASNSKWLIARKNRLTASNFGVVLAARRRNRYPPSLFKRISGKI